MVKPFSSFDKILTNPGGPPRWFVSISSSWLDEDIKKRSAFSISVTASSGSG